MEEATLLLQSLVAQFIFNLDSSRVRPASREIRKEGWTEVWSQSRQTDPVERPPNATPGEQQQQQQQQQQDNYKESSINHSDCTLTLIQFRPAWLEQFLLRVAGIPHTVIHSKYAATESSGPLPCLRHGSALVGRHHPTNPIHQEQSSSSFRNHSTNFIMSQNHIIQYLETQFPQIKQICNIQNISPEKKPLFHLIQSIFTEKLEPAMQILTFSDHHAWEQLYRPQYLQASRGSPFGARFQVWCLRVMACKQYSHVKSPYCLETIKECYDTFEAILQSESMTATTNTVKSPNTLLGTPIPTLVDALLWAHLADALDNANLVPILANYPRMISFFQYMFETIFVHVKINVQTVGENPFLDPLELRYHPMNRASAESPYTSSLEMMQSLRPPNWQHALLEAKQVYQSQVKPREKSRDLIATWCLGGTWQWDSKKTKKNHKNNEEKDEESADSAQQQQETWREGQKLQDELWISCVVAATALAFVFGRQGNGGAGKIR